MRGARRRYRGFCCCCYVPFDLVSLKLVVSADCFMQGVGIHPKNFSKQGTGEFPPQPLSLPLHENPAIASQHTLMDPLSALPFELRSRIYSYHFAPATAPPLHAADPPIRPPAQHTDTRSRETAVPKSRQAGRQDAAR